MRRSEYRWGTAAVLTLTAASLAGVAATGLPAHSGLTAARPAVDSCAVPRTLPGQRVTVMLADMPGGTGMMGGARMMRDRMVLRAVPSAVRAGTVSFVAVNRGTRIHELVVLPLAAGAAAGDRAVRPHNRVSEAGSLGEASATCHGGTGDGIRPGAAGWTTLTLPPGRYELVCNRPGHYVAGMHTELDVG